jgi:hypothetical protein
MLSKTLPFGKYSLADFYNKKYFSLKFHDRIYTIGGKPIPINPLGERLFPTVSMWRHISVEANFGAKPFKYDIQNCPGFVVI